MMNFDLSKLFLIAKNLRDARLRFCFSLDHTVVKLTVQLNCLLKPVSNAVWCWLWDIFCGLVSSNYCRSRHGSEKNALEAKIVDYNGVFAFILH